MSALNNIRATTPIIVNGNIIYAHPVHWQLPEEGFSLCRRCVVDVLDEQDEVVRLRAVEVPVSEVALAYEWASGRTDARRVEFKADLSQPEDLRGISRLWGGGEHKHEPVTSRRLRHLEDALVEVRDGWGGVATVRVSPRRAAFSDGATGVIVVGAAALVGVLAVMDDPLAATSPLNRASRLWASPEGDLKGQGKVGS